MKKSGTFLDLLLDNWWLRHLLFWIFILNWFTWGFGFTEGGMKAAYIRNAKFIPGYLLVVYPLLYFLIPKFLMKKHYFLFFTGFISLIIAAAVFTEQFQLNFSENELLKGFDYKWGKNILPYVNVASIATAIKFQWKELYIKGHTF